MCKKLIYFSYLLLLFTSCEEYYTPVIDTIGGQLVVEALLTNDASKNFVHLTTTSSFYDKMAPKAVSGAVVELVEVNGSPIQGVENVPGYFYFSIVPEVGRDYVLRIKINNETFESKVVKMPPLPKITNCYSGYVEKKIYTTDAYGVPVASVVQGRYIYTDLTVANSLSYYRFNVRSVLEWIYAPPAIGGPLPPQHFGWQSYFENAQFNIAGPKQFSQAGKIEKHPVLFLLYDTRSLLKPDSTQNGWIVIIDQYGTSKESYDFHEKLNSQFAANGSLFDPIQTQIYGNITCTSNPSKIAFGYFDLNSYQQYRYYIYMSAPDPNNPIIPRQIFRYPYIPDSGETVTYPPDWWEL